MFHKWSEGEKKNLANMVHLMLPSCAFRIIINTKTALSFRVGGMSWENVRSSMVNLLKWIKCVLFFNTIKLFKLHFQKTIILYNYELRFNLHTFNKNKKSKNHIQNAFFIQHFEDLEFYHHLAPTKVIWMHLKAL